MSAAQMEALATSGAFGCFGMTRREALWAAGVYSAARDDQLVTVTTGAQAPPLPEMARIEEASADFWSTGLSPDYSPVQFLRPILEKRGVLTAQDLEVAWNGSVVKVAGVVTHRQRPATARGTIFVSLEDETGLINVICPQRVWDRYRKVARSAKALLITGRLERAEGVINLAATKLEALSLSTTGDHLNARDFR
jgi:error-prone DNA polymerase